MLVRSRLQDAGARVVEGKPRGTPCPLCHRDSLGVRRRSTGVRATDLDRLNDRFVHYLNFGGYPEVIFSEEIQADPGRFIKSDIIDIRLRQRGPRS